MNTYRIVCGIVYGISVLVLSVLTNSYTGVYTTGAISIQGDPMTINGQTSKSYTLYISDEAYDTLCEQARLAGHIHPSNYTNSKGIRHYVEWLVRQRLIDNRPPYIRETDQEMLNEGMSPEWRLYGPRRRRTMVLTDATLVDASKWAMLLGIAYTPHRRIIGAPTYLDGAQCVAAILEAIGSNWIQIEVISNE